MVGASKGGDLALALAVTQGSKVGKYMYNKFQQCCEKGSHRFRLLLQSTAVLEVQEETSQGG